MNMGNTQNTAFTTEADAARYAQAAEVEVEQLLKNPNLIELIEEDLQAIGIVGEEDLSLTLYVVGTSRLLHKPLSAIVRGNSGTGKSHVGEKVAGLFKDNKQRISATDITPKVLLKVPEGFLEHKFIVSGERARDTSETGQERTRIMRQLTTPGNNI